MTMITNKKNRLYGGGLFIFNLYFLLNYSLKIIERVAVSLTLFISPDQPTVIAEESPCLA